MKNQYILLNLFRFKCNELILIDNRGNKKGETSYHFFSAELKRQFN